MENKMEAFATLKGVYESFLFAEYGVGVDLICVNYSNDGLKFHEWEISPIIIAGESYSKLRLSKYTLDDIMIDINNYPLDVVIERNKDILSSTIL